MGTNQINKEKMLANMLVESVMHVGKGTDPDIVCVEIQHSICLEFMNNFEMRN